MYICMLTVSEYEHMNHSPVLGRPVFRNMKISPQQENIFASAGWLKLGLCLGLDYYNGMCSHFLIFYITCSSHTSYESGFSCIQISDIPTVINHPINFLNVYVKIWASYAFT
jgi:hypothetical protein